MTKEFKLDILVTDHDFSDALISFGKEEIKAHRGILKSFCFGYIFSFSGIIQGKKLSLFYEEQRLTINILQCLISFVHKGETEIYETYLEDFFMLAEELNVIRITQKGKKFPQIQNAYFHLSKRVISAIFNHI